MKPGKRREKMPPFVALPRAMLKESAWRTGLSSSAKIVYVHLKYKFVGTNNGEICLHYSELKDFMASATICRAFKELEVKEWIHKEQIVGGKYRFTVKYRLTGKHDEAISRFKL